MVKTLKSKSVFAVITMLTSNMIYAAALDRSGQDSSIILQDGTYAELGYSRIEADVSGRDMAGRQIGNIAKDYDFFRAGAKMDMNDRVSFALFYDEPFGALVNYTGENSFTKPADGVALGLIKQVTNSQRQEQLTDLAVGYMLKALSSSDANEAQAYSNLAELYGGTQQTLERVATAVEQGATPAQIAQSLSQSIPNSLAISADKIATIETALSKGTMSADATKEVQQGLAGFKASAAQLAEAPTALNAITTDRGATRVKVQTRNITGLVGLRFGEKNQYQVFGGPVVQRLSGNVHLRGDAYLTTTGYDAKIKEDTALGYAIGLAYYNPAKALKAALTYRSEIVHHTEIDEYIPLAPVNGVASRKTSKYRGTTPESWNLDLQTGLSAKYRLLGLLKVRYAPWATYRVTPPYYHELTKLRYPSGLNLADYDKDQWSFDVGLARQMNEKLVVSGGIGWDRGAGNPTQTLGPVKGYYSLSAGFKYHFTPAWSLSAGAKYLKFGNATAQLPDHTTTVGHFSDNHGYAFGVKFAYQKK